MHNNDIVEAEKIKEMVDLEKSVPSKHVPHHATRKLVTALILEVVISILVYYKYDSMGERQPLIAPALLGASTAALAQSFSQYQRGKFNLQRVFKFIVWGIINGVFTVLWVEVLIVNFNSLAYRVMVDQLVGTPAFQLVFSLINAFWNTGEVSISTRQSFFKALKYSYFYWPFFSISSFLFIPKSMIFPANCLANLIWNIILSKLV
ncbi:Piso0_002488 [Millerozyma farinosa CBS 7064]|uniref:Piso0_002488 protein n=1 Tax=Pichia sorbitophila (strain ATCC MYA-4447 / BCRC 22081 / CBS 7064 / NBRC 10061 / NRRL Y-12695) TaxID=559304 RepID=G8YF65_PICSO|nr:Piso0_002488 [Millerozyma farinosa CBS 7064]